MLKTKHYIFTFLISFILLSSFDLEDKNFNSNTLVKTNENLLNICESYVLLGKGDLKTNAGLHKNGKVYLGLRDFMEYMDYYVIWDKYERTATIKNKVGKIKIFVDDATYIKNGEKYYFDDVIEINNNKTFISVDSLEEIAFVELLTTDIASDGSVKGVVFERRY